MDQISTQFYVNFRKDFCISGSDNELLELLSLISRKKSLKVVNNTLNKTPTHHTDTYDRLGKFLLPGNVWFLE